MMRSAGTIGGAILTILVLGSRPTAGASGDPFLDGLPQRVLYLEPAAFPSAPHTVREKLEAIGCRVPQSYLYDLAGNPLYRTPHNVMSGRFKDAETISWAVICEPQGILVLSADGESVEEVLSFPPADKEGWPRVRNDSKPYGALIDAVGEEYIIEHYQRYGGPKPPPIDHEGVNWVHLEKGSIVFYWFGGRWLELQGAD